MISMNSMYPFFHNHIQGEPMTATMLAWLSTVLNNNQQYHPSRKFIIMSHVWVGLDFYRDVNSMWNETYTEDYLNLLKDFESQHLLSIGGHIHLLRVQAPIAPNGVNLV